MKNKKKQKKKINKILIHMIASKMGSFCILQMVLKTYKNKNIIKVYSPN